MGSLLRFCGAQESTEISDTPASIDFVRRTWARALVIDDYLYIDGGTVSQRSQGTYQGHKSVTSTLSIPLSQSWTPANVKMRQIRKDAPIVQRQAVFADHSSKSFWVWGGLNENKTRSQTELWKFTADGQGGGSWAIDENLNQGQADFHRSHGGAFTSASNSAFYIGGMEETTTAIKPDMPNGGYMSGFVSFNFTSSSQDRVWRNTTEAPYSKSKTLYAASAQYIPKFGSQGLIMILGGAHYDAASTKSNDNAMDIVWLMDPVTRTWYSQQTTGDSPPARRWSCTVGAKSLNDTYEIFIFGGHVDGRIGFGDIWILSLPGFVWARAAYTKTPRAQMGCVVAGRRQLITVGGVDPTLLSSQLLSTKDPLDQGLGIFDLTKLQWKTQYDHDAAAYDSPDVIKSWYDNPENLSNVQYNEGVATLFNSSFGRDRSSDAKDNH
ncbi:Kelch repeat-containing protein [Colletotrichum fructicola]|nr:Kelch repeat-containing protein [Colletotrichum fructicola]